MLGPGCMWGIRQATPAVTCLGARKRPRELQAEGTVGTEFVCREARPGAVLEGLEARARITDGVHFLKLGRRLS